MLPSKSGDWDSVVRIATRYGLDGLRIESKWRRDFFRAPPDRPRVFTGGNAAGAGDNHRSPMLRMGGSYILLPSMPA
jgi:hypothetical protein